LIPRPELIVSKDSPYQRFWYNSSEFSLVLTPLEAAKALLEKEGYTITITPPKPKLSGDVVLYKLPGSDTISCRTEREWDKFTTAGKQARTILAIVHWTEGDGLTVPLVGDADSMV
jgi:hypothetical protein